MEICFFLKKILAVIYYEKSNLYVSIHLTSLLIIVDTFALLIPVKIGQFSC